MTHFQQVLHEGGTIGDLKRRRENYTEQQVKETLERAEFKRIRKIIINKIKQDLDNAESDY